MGDYGYGAEDFAYPGDQGGGVGYIPTAGEGKKKKKKKDKRDQSADSYGGQDAYGQPSELEKQVRFQDDSNDMGQFQESHPDLQQGYAHHPMARQPRNPAERFEPSLFSASGHSSVPSTLGAAPPGVLDEAIGTASNLSAVGHHQTAHYALDMFGNPVVDPYHRRSGELGMPDSVSDFRDEMHRPARAVYTHYRGPEPHYADALGSDARFPERGFAFSMTEVPLMDETGRRRVPKFGPEVPPHNKESLFGPRWNPLDGVRKNWGENAIEGAPLVALGSASSVRGKSAAGVRPLVDELQRSQGRADALRLLLRGQTIDPETGKPMQTEGRMQIKVPHLKHGRLGLQMQGATVARLEEPWAEQMGFEAGDVVIGINGMPTVTGRDFSAALQRATAEMQATGRPMLFDIARLHKNEHQAYYGDVDHIAPPTRPIAGIHEDNTPMELRGYAPRPMVPPFVGAAPMGPQGMRPFPPQPPPQAMLPGPYPAGPRPLPTQGALPPPHVILPQGMMGVPAIRAPMPPPPGVVVGPMQMRPPYR